MRHLAIRFKSGVICAYPSTTESDYDGLVRSVSAGMWVHQYVYGMSYTLGIPGRIVESSGVFSQSGWVQEAILYDDLPEPLPLVNPHGPSPIVNVRAAQPHAGFSALEPAPPSSLPPEAPTSPSAPPVQIPAIPPVVQVRPAPPVVQVRPVKSSPGYTFRGASAAAGASIAAAIAAAVARIRRNKPKKPHLDISAYRPDETKPPKRKP